MNAFTAASRVEARSLEVLRPYIQQKSYNGQFVATAKGPLARELQKEVGDFLYNVDPETVFSIEVKAEEKNRFGNLFLETWSNLARFTPGWMLTLRADLLLYHFVNDGDLYVVPFARLRKWAFQDRRIYSYPERPQGKYVQLNDTWGRCVPITVLEREVSLSRRKVPIPQTTAIVPEAAQ